MSRTPDQDEPKYRIGAVCRLTGLSQHVLRVWEKRYRAVEPERTASQRRVYRESDINRLALLKALVDRGQAIGSIANLETAELERRLRQYGAPARISGHGRKPALALLGESFASHSDACSGSGFFQFAGQFNDIDNFNSQPPRAKIDIAVVEWPSLHPDSGVEVMRLRNRLQATQLILIYDYASQAALRHLHAGITALRAPLDLTALEAVVGAAYGFQPSADEPPMDLAAVPPPRRFDDRQLAFLAAQSPAIACECPVHLAQLITSLVRFEMYSAECESRNAQDAALHHRLHQTTAQARHMMERALAHVVELEGLSPPGHA